MRITLFRTKIYERSLASLSPGVSIDALDDDIAKDPLRWPVIPGTGGIRKARFALGHKGKRGGGHVCYFYLVSEGHIYFLKAYAKNTQTDLTPDDKKVLRRLVQQIKEALS